MAWANRSVVYVQATHGMEASKAEGAMRGVHPSRHHRYRSWPSMESLADLAVPLSVMETLERVAQEFVMVMGLALKLWNYLGLGVYGGKFSPTSPLQQKLCFRLLTALLLQDGNGWSTYIA